MDFFYSMNLFLLPSLTLQLGVAVQGSFISCTAEINALRETQKDRDRETGKQE